MSFLTLFTGNRRIWFSGSRYNYMDFLTIKSIIELGFAIAVAAYLIWFITRKMNGKLTILVNTFVLLLPKIDSLIGNIESLNSTMSSTMKKLSDDLSTSNQNWLKWEERYKEQQIRGHSFWEAPEKK